MKTEIIKCGEIFRCGPEKFIFSCTYCGDQFNSNVAALRHIDEHFPVDYEEEKFADLLQQLPIDENTDELPPLNASEHKYKIDVKLEPLDSITFLEIECLPYYPLSSNCPNNGDKHLEYHSEVNTSPASSNKTLKKEQNQPKWGPSTKQKSMVECDICGRQMQRMSILKHFRLHAKGFKTKVDLTDGIERNLRHEHWHWKGQIRWGPTMTKNTLLECDICGKRMRRRGFKSHLLFHTKTFNPFTCDYCGDHFRNQQNLITHIRRHTGERPYKCEICGKTFAVSTTLTIHLRYHTGERPYKCKFCDETFVTNSRWNIHMRQHTNKQHRLKCSYCEKTFANGTTRDDHHRSQHTGERPFECQVCGQMFSRRNILRQHAVLHTGKKPYKCRVCDARFAQCAGRRSHERSAHKEVAHLIKNPNKMYLYDDDGFINE